MVEPNRRPTGILFALGLAVLVALCLIVFKNLPVNPELGSNLPDSDLTKPSDDKSRDEKRSRRIVLAVRSILSGETLSGVKFRADRVEFTSNDKGELNLPLTSKGVVCVDVSWMGREVAVGDDTTCWLIPRGFLRLRCKDPQGADIAGVPYSVTIDGLAATMMTATRRDPALGATLGRFLGRARYRSNDRIELPVVGPVRVLFAGGHRISGRIVPVPVSRDERGRVQHRPGPALQRYSDIHVSLEQGGTVEKECVLDRPCVITGQALPVQDPAVTVTCTLFHRIGKPDVVEHWDQERKIKIGNGEPFRIEGVLPGRKKLRIRWFTPSALWSCMVLFDLEPAAVHDVGFVRPQRGVNMAVSFSVKLDEATPVPLGTLVKTPVPIEVSVSGPNPGKAPETWVAADLSVADLRETLTIHGLPAGKLALTLSDPIPVPGFRPEWTGMLTQQIAVAPQGEVVLPYRSVSDARILLVGRHPSAVGDRVQLVVRNRESNRILRLKGVVASDSSVRLQRQLDRSVALAFLWNPRRRLVAGPLRIDARSGDVRLAPVPATTIEGVLVGGARVPVRLAAVEDKRFIVQSTISGKDGRFQFDGVTPNRDWIVLAGRRQSCRIRPRKGAVLRMRPGSFEYK